MAIVEQVRLSQERYLEAKAEAEKRRRERDELVVVAHDLHQASYRELSRALGLAISQVHRILTDSEQFRSPKAG